MIQKIKDRLEKIWIELKFRFSSMREQPSDRVSEQWLMDHKDE